MEFLVKVTLLFAVFCCANSIKQDKTTDHHHRISKGEPAHSGQFPWQVALLVDGTRIWESWFCGGSIISNEWILTAGHCVNEALSVTVIAGNIHWEHGKNLTSKNFFPHEYYVSEFSLVNDIGLVQLEKKLTFNKNIKPISLSSAFLESDVEAVASGWGKNGHDGKVRKRLSYIEMITISNYECGEYYDLNDDEVCAHRRFSQWRETCHGDSGGAVIKNVDSNPIQVAIVSFVSSAGCEVGLPSGHTRVAFHKDWIEKRTGIQLKNV